MPSSTVLAATGPPARALQDVLLHETIAPWHATAKEAVVFQTFEGNLLPTESDRRRWLRTFVEFPFLTAATPFRTLAGRREPSDEVAHATPV